MRKRIFFGFMLVVLIAAGCKGEQAPKQTVAKGDTAMTFSLTSTAFRDGAAVPKKYSCDGDDVSPDLAWNGTPAGTKSLALILDDPDAPMGTWTHWVMWGIPGEASTLPEGMERSAQLAGGIHQGLNSWPKAGYNGPCPPPGKPHRYYFKLFALDLNLDLPANANKSALENAMKGHILAQTQLMGTYKR